jgi:hypothetical protein
MNTLFIGPYRQSDLNGCFSMSLVKHLLKTKNENIFTPRPIYLDDSMTQDCEKTVMEAEQCAEDRYDIILQNLPIESCNSLHGYKNYIVPITNNRKLSIESISNLQKYDKILTDNVFDHSRFSEFFPEKTFLFDYDIDNLETNIKPINLGIYNHMRKLYFIGDYSQNSDLIRTLIASFISLHRYRENLCIVFFLTDNNTKIVDELKQFSNQAYKQLNIGNVIDKNVFVNINLDEKSIAMCHRTGDVFLDLNEDSNNSYHKKNAEKFGNLVVGRENLNFYTNLVRNNNINFDQYLIASQASIETKIATTLDKPETNTENINGNTLEQLLWN